MKRIGINILISIILLSTGAGLLIAATRIPGFASTYTREVYPFIVRVLGGFSGLFPFALAELLLYLLVILGAVYIVRHIFRPLLMLTTLLIAASLLFFLYAACCGVNYHAETWAEATGLEVGTYTVDELNALCGLLVAEVNENGTDSGGKSHSPGERRELSRAAMSALGERYEALSGYYPLPKPVCWSWLLSIQQVTGVYSPFTVEALYNRDMPDYNIPHTLCHELSHLKGFMREDEANFIGFLACIGSDDAEFRYSGYLTAFVYAGNALARTDRAAYGEIYAGLCDEAKADLAANNAYWAQYDGPVAEAQDEINDAYLRAAGDERGIASYDHFTELMLAYYS